MNKKFAQVYSPTQVLSCENDFILNDESQFTPIYEDYKTDKNILKRQSRDTKIDQGGKELLLKYILRHI
jgi:hypothetical protein